ncbi:biotin sulfoxide reductase [Striga asiatica]|uniref:Biotin sulfoxide reductase n=1 Tax=Striga asiatica TaxID=4170 RepID=A0A5A7QPP2_STRAF|nr:biotin sulfoxide reductase [Striga asiatica]
MPVSRTCHYLLQARRAFKSKSSTASEGFEQNQFSADWHGNRCIKKRRNGENSGLLRGVDWARDPASVEPLGVVSAESEPLELKDGGREEEKEGVRESDYEELCRVVFAQNLFFLGSQNLQWLAIFFPCTVLTLLRHLLI